MPRNPLFLLILAFLAFASGCDSSSDSPTEYGRWGFTGFVLDGSTNQALEGARVTWVESNGASHETKTGADGQFSAAGIPYGAQTFRFSAVRILAPGDTMRFTERLITVASITESNTMEGTIPSGTRVVSLYPLRGTLQGEVALRLAGASTVSPAESVCVRLRYRDTSIVGIAPSTFETWTDASGAFRFRGLPADTGLTLSIGRTRLDAGTFAGAAVAVPRLLSQAEVILPRIELQQDSAPVLKEPVLSSNVLGSDGQGLVGLAVSVVPWYKLGVKPDSTRLDLQVAVGSQVFSVQPQVRSDTLFLRHVTPFPADAQVSVTINGSDLGGKSFKFTLDGTRRFKTRSAVAAVESNAWVSSKAFRSGFAPGDTLWLRFSEPLDTANQRLQWAAPSAGKALYGSGTQANAATWVRGDTLFVRPDQRLSVVDTNHIGFKVMVSAASGSVSAATEVVAAVDLRVPRVRWTNLRSPAGASREDVGVRDSLVIVSDRPLASVIGAVGSGTLSIPVGILPSSISLRGRDTIVVKPSIAMDPGIAYGMAFDVVSAEGATHRGVLAVAWKVASTIRILSLDNRAADGFRRFASLGDSLTVVFSEAVDTSKPFTVRMSDVNGIPVQVKPRWTAGNTTAVLRIASPLPLADFGSPAVATSDGDYAKAVADASFDLVTARGETVRTLKPATEPMRLYTEEGLCVVATNLVRNHASGYEVLSTDAPVDSFPRGSALWLTFNRVLDTAAIQRDGSAKFAILETSSGTAVSTTATFADGGRTLKLAPSDPLAADGTYFLRLKAVPAQGVRDAGMVHRHGGTYTGAASGGYFLKSSFVAR